jgi:CRP-like cAMP-binding protein
MAVKRLRARALRSVPLFAGFSRREIADVATIAAEKEFPAGEELTREGDPGHFFYVLLEGTTDIFRGGEKIATRSPGDFLGEIALLGHSARTATVTTTSPARALVIHDRAFRSFIGRHPDVQHKVLEALAERL